MRTNMQTGADSTTGMGAMDDPGAQDNRISIDPNDTRWAALLATWGDGGEYEVKAKIRQISPGEFEVTELTGEEGETDATSGAEETGEPAAPQGGLGYRNPAVASLGDEGV